MIWVDGTPGPIAPESRRAFERVWRGAAFVEGHTRSAVAARLRAAGSVYAEDEADILLSAAETAEDLERMVRERVAGRPLEYTVGWAWFCGLKIVVEPGVFVPRVRTEFLARQAAARLSADAVVVDLCCGTGALGAALLAAAPEAAVYAVDRDPAAVRCARRNLSGGRVYEGNLYEALPEELAGRVTLMVANAPYVPTAALAQLPREARLHEAPMALDGGADGLDILRRVADGAPRWLAPGGHLLVEASEAQGPVLAAYFRGVGLREAVASSEELEATVVVGTQSQRTYPRDRIPDPARGLK